MSRKAKDRKAAALKRLPVLSDEEVKALDARSGLYGLRCFFGIHRKVLYYWPAWHKTKVSQRVTCRRCGEIRQIIVLPYPEQNAEAV